MLFLEHSIYNQKKQFHEKKILSYKTENPPAKEKAYGYSNGVMFHLSFYVMIMWRAKPSLTRYFKIYKCIKMSLQSKYVYI